MGKTTSIETVSIEKRLYDLEELLKISKVLNSTLDYSILLDSIRLICMAQLRVLKVGLLVHKDIDSTRLSLHRNYEGFEIDHAKDYSIDDKHPLIELFNTKTKCYTFDEVLQETSNPNTIEGLLSLKPALMVPLKIKNRIMGIIILADRIDESDFNEYEKNLVMDISALAAVAINNAVTYEIATTDMMTKLKLKHYFLSSMSERIQSAMEKRTDLSILMLDLDHFKNINDTYGHPTGDAVLKTVASSISNTIRSIDIAARYGGEEFILLLTGSNKDCAIATAERIRQAVEASETVYEQHCIKVTISCGVSSFCPDKDLEPMSLISRADEALYKSKQDGRNRVTFIAVD
jgi:diguanylate cyclase (GGDEF)-like protein